MAKKKIGKFSSFLNNPMDFTLLITIILLIGVGLVMLLSASSPSALADTGDSYRYFKRHDLILEKRKINSKMKIVIKNLEKFNKTN